VGILFEISSFAPYIYSFVVLSDKMPPQEIKKRILIFCRDKLERFKTPAKINVVNRTNFNDRFKKVRK